MEKLFSIVSPSARLVENFNSLWGTEELLGDERMGGLSEGPYGRSRGGGGMYKTDNGISFAINLP